MAEKKIPYFAVPGTITKILEKIKTAATPENFNGDFLENTLLFKGGNYKTFIQWGKKVGLINSDGTPTALYKKFRNPTTSRSSLGEALRTGYADIFAMDENADKLEKSKFKALVMEATGEAHDSKVLELMVNTFWNAKALADFDSSTSKSEQDVEEANTNVNDKARIHQEYKQQSSGVKLGLSYTINLVLPKTDDPAIFNAIFKSLRDNLLNG
ncbi:MAG: DUF5343 domain-containing protein [Bacteroidetes bacterium]|nr:DUF5343 domain-containing protein [Bacteroidota bacterium]